MFNIRTKIYDIASQALLFDTPLLPETAYKTGDLVSINVSIDMHGLTCYYQVISVVVWSDTTTQYINLWVKETKRVYDDTTLTIP